jgi:hypothetical protein
MKMQLFCWAGLLAGLAAISLAADPVTTDKTNPHYYSLNGRPLLLITSAEHYGGVINKAFDYVAYFDSLKANGLNYTRIYPGAMFEPMGKFVEGNTLGPKMQDLVLPWARSNQPGYLFGGNKFDLDRWDEAYFSRLKQFISEAAKRGIVVEVCLFNSQYSDAWMLSPLYHENNIQGVGDCNWRDAQSLQHADLVRREDDYVRKIVAEVNEFDDVILEFCDEPAHIGTGIPLAGPWVGHGIGVVHEAEASLPKKHLLGQEGEGPFGGGMDFSADARASVIVAQYIWGNQTETNDVELGGMRALDFLYGLNKPIEMNETHYFPLSYEGDAIADSRVEAWEFMTGGGAGFNQLNGLYTVENPSGKTPEGEQLWRGLRNLRAFLDSFDYVRMHPDREFLAGNIAQGVYVRVLSEPGKQYSMYIHHSGDRSRGSYQVRPGNYQERLAVNMPEGSYRAEWIDPAGGTIIESQTIQAKDGPCRLTTPRYTVDVALRMKRVQP